MFSPEKQQIDLIFTRDFSLYMAEIWYDLLTHDLGPIYGATFSDQLTVFTGRSSEFYRKRTEVDHMKKMVVSRPIHDPLFTDATLVPCLKAADELWQIVRGPVAQEITLNHLETILRLFKAMYPAYMLGVVLPSAWADAVREHHSNDADILIDRFFEVRKKLEGLFEETDAYIRKYIAPVLAEGYIPFSYARLLTEEEVFSLVAHKSLPPLSTLEHRARGYIFSHRELRTHESFSDALERLAYVYTAPVQMELVEFKGSVAYLHPIPVRGMVRVVYRVEDLEPFAEGDILVAPMTAPDFLPKMRIASAIVTDEGGITCHASIVARELKKPCVIGTKIATKVLKDGDEVEVDARNGVVRILK